MYVSCSCLCFVQSRYPTLEDALTKIEDLGFGAFDLDVLENWQHVMPSKLADDGEYLREMAETINASGLAASSFNCGPSTKLSDPDADAFAQYKKEFAAIAELAGEVGCPNVTLQPGPIVEGHSQDELLRATTEHLKELAELCGDAELTIGLEGHAHTPIEKPDAAIQVIEAVWPVVGYTYDPSHPELQGIPLQDTECLFDYVVHVHVRNASLENMQDTMANGTVEFEWVIPALSRHGYDGALTIEYFNDFDLEFQSTRALRDKLVGLGVRSSP